MIVLIILLIMIAVMPLAHLAVVRRSVADIFLRLGASPGNEIDLTPPSPCLLGNHADLFHDLTII